MRGGRAGGRRRVGGGGGIAVRGRANPNRQMLRESSGRLREIAGPLPNSPKPQGGTRVHRGGRRGQAEGKGRGGGGDAVAGI